MRLRGSWDQVRAARPRRAATPAQKRRRAATAASLVLALGAVSACGSSEDGASGAGGAGSGGTAGTGGSLNGGACNVVVEEHPSAGNEHVEICSDVSYATNPPTSGAHYGRWPQFRTYDVPLPHGYLVHGLEHGAVAYLYNCPEGCDDEVAAVQKFIDETLPVDVNCASQGMNRRRVVLTPDPTLASRWAAAAWQWSLTADCFDEERFLGFYERRYNEGPEKVCSDGVDPAVDGGIPPDCGPPGS